MSRSRAHSGARACRSPARPTSTSSPTSLGQFERGEITPEQWRVFRLVRGTYGQRQADDAQMIRVKIPQGVLTGEQLHALADVAEQYSRGFGHITTRQNVQFHFVKLHDVEPAMRRLADGGPDDARSVRQFGAQHHGVPVRRRRGRRAVRRHAVRRGADALPAAASAELVAAAQVQDRVRRLRARSHQADDQRHRLARAWSSDGRRGFRVYVGGGTATMTTAATVLFDFLPVDEMLNVAEAIIRVFHARGDYQHKQRNRMKFLIKSIGWEALRAGVRRRAGGGARRRRAAAAVRCRAAARRSRARLAADGGAVDRRRSPRAWSRGVAERARHHPVRRTHAGSRRRRAIEHWARTNVARRNSIGLRARRRSPCRSAT